MQVEKRLMELGEQVQANGSDVQDDKAAVLLGPLALNEAICLEAVHEPGDVRYPRDHLGQDCLCPSGKPAWLWAFDLLA